MKTLEDRARTAYFRRFGDDAPIPSVVDETGGVVELYNVNIRRDASVGREAGEEVAAEARPQLRTERRGD